MLLTLPVVSEGLNIRKLTKPYNSWIAGSQTSLYSPIKAYGMFLEIKDLNSCFEHICLLISENQNLHLCLILQSEFWYTSNEVSPISFCLDFEADTEIAPELVSRNHFFSWSVGSR